MKSFRVGGQMYEVNSYETAPNLTTKGVIRGIPLEDDVRTINEKVVNSQDPAALVAKRLGNMTTVIVAFDGLRVPTLVRYGATLLRCILYRKQIDVCYQFGRLGHRMDVCPTPHDEIYHGCGARNPSQEHKCTPRCSLCGGTHLTADRVCRARFKTPYIVRKRRWERRQEEDMELATLETTIHSTQGSQDMKSQRPKSSSTSGSTSRGRSRRRSGGRSKGRSWSRSLTTNQRQSRSRSRPCQDGATDNVSWADAVKGEPKRRVSGASTTGQSSCNNETLLETQRENARPKELVQQLAKEIQELRQDRTIVPDRPVSEPGVGADTGNRPPATKKRVIQSTR